MATVMTASSMSSLSRSARAASVKSSVTLKPLAGKANACASLAIGETANSVRRKPTPADWNLTATAVCRQCAIRLPTVRVHADATRAIQVTVTIAVPSMLALLRMVAAMSARHATRQVLAPASAPAMQTLLVTDCPVLLPTCAWKAMADATAMRRALQANQVLSIASVMKDLSAQE